MAKAKHRATKPTSKRGTKAKKPPKVPRAKPAEAVDDASDSTAVLPPFPIAGIGASAGGLEAISELLSALPTDPNIAIVIVQHLAPSHDSILPDLLAASSHVPVLRVEDEMELKPGRAYVIPPNVDMGVAGGKLRLTPRADKQGQHMAIDFFFRSLAEFAQSRAIGIVLSGNASDGSIGLREIKAVGGITIAQEPRTARYDGMPRAAIATGTVDLVLPPAQIAEELARIVTHPLVARRPRTPDSAEPALPEDQLARVFNLLRAGTGVDFSQYKLPTIRRRLHRRMVLHKITQLDEYIRFLQQNSDEVKALYQDLLIHVTRFFREPESFKVLSEQVFPRLLEGRRDDDTIRVWVPGCSTGEEPYSLAICLQEYLTEAGRSTPIQIFATDISEVAIDRARAGIYPETIAADVSPERLRRFFNKVDGSYRISKPVRDTCVFARQDLTRDPPFSKLDLVVCRNVMIYLGTVLQKRLLSVFHYALKPSGFLMLGAAETIGPYIDLFATADKKHRLYMKKSAPVRTEVDFPVERPPQAKAGKKPAIEQPSAGNAQNEANRVILSRYAPPGVIVDSDYQIVQFRGQTGSYLEPAPGEASLNLLKMAREGLLYGLRTCLQEARRTDAPARKEGLRVKHNGHVNQVTLEVIPLGTAPRHYLILFHSELVAPHPTQAAESTRRGKGKLKVGKTDADHRVIRLEEELAANREYLQSIIQDLEATNEELQSANEEILSSNEELQSTNEELDTAKEELQSTNEELNTVNEELHGRNEELSRANSDLLNLLANVQIAIVIVASDLRIRRFTPMAERILNLIPTDIGRRISDIKPNIDCPDLEQMIVQAIETITLQEREVLDREGNRYALRVRPYKNVDNRIDGAVLALFETGTTSTDLRAEAARSLRELAVAVIDSMNEPVLLLETDLTVRSANSAFLAEFSLPRDEVEGRSVFELPHDGRWDDQRLRSLFQQELPKNHTVQGYPVGADHQRLLAKARRIRGEFGTPGVIVLSLGQGAT